MTGNVNPLGNATRLCDVFDAADSVLGGLADDASSGAAKVGRESPSADVPCSANLDGLAPVSATAENLRTFLCAPSSALVGLRQLDLFPLRQALRLEPNT